MSCDKLKDEMFPEFDKDKDGGLNSEEFEEFIKALVVQ